MSRSRLLRAGLCVWLGLACGGCDHTPPRPHVLLVSIDALRQDHVGAYGYERDTTPWLDAFARTGVVHDRAYTAAAWTLISHMSMLTGLHAEQHGVVADGLRVSAEVPLLAERLGAQGYATGAVYYEGWLHERFGFDRGFQQVTQARRADAAVDAAERFLASVPAGQPAFLFLHVYDVHSAPVDASDTIYAPPPGYDQLWIPDAVERLADLDDPQAVYLGEAQPTARQREAIVALYDGNVRWVDDQLRRLFEGLEQRGLLEDSLVIVTSDHGEALNQRPGVGGHGGMYEEGLRVPLVVRYPEGWRAGTRRDDAVSLVDLVPTVLTALELPAEDWLAGVPLQQAPTDERLIRVQRPPKRVLIQGPWKLVWTESKRMAQGRMLNLDLDPTESAPMLLAQATKGVIAVSKGMLGRAAREDHQRPAAPGQAEPSEPMDSATEQQLRQLGYLGDH